jgi:hypothetical protein
MDLNELKFKYLHIMTMRFSFSPFNIIMFCRDEDKLFAAIRKACYDQIFNNHVIITINLNFTLHTSDKGILLLRKH